MRAALSLQRFVEPHPNFSGKLAPLADKVSESAGEVPFYADKLNTVAGKLVNCGKSIHTNVQGLGSASWIPSIQRLQSDPLTFTVVSCRVPVRRRYNWGCVFDWPSDSYGSEVSSMSCFGVVGQILPISAH